MDGWILHIQPFLEAFNLPSSKTPPREIWFLLVLKNFSLCSQWCDNIKMCKNGGTLKRNLKLKKEIRLRYWRHSDEEVNAMFIQVQSVDCCHKCSVPIHRSLSNCFKKNLSIKLKEAYILGNVFVHFFFLRMKWGVESCSISVALHRLEARRSSKCGSILSSKADKCFSFSLNRYTNRCFCRELHAVALGVCACLYGRSDSNRFVFFPSHLWMTMMKIS